MKRPGSYSVTGHFGFVLISGGISYRACSPFSL